MTEAAFQALVRRDRLLVILAIAGISAMAWIYVLWLAAHMSVAEQSMAPHADSMPGMNMPGMDMPGDDAMSGMDMASGMRAAVDGGFRPWRLADFIFMFAMWAVMMVGMMTPSVAPMVLLYAAAGRKLAKSGRPLAATGWFLAGYLLVWTAFSLAATGAQWLLTRLALLTPMMASGSLVFGGFVLIAAGIYQWSPLKNICLRQCQSPLGFLMSSGGFRSGPLGALRLGAHHGAYCLGCCWALMMLLFVGGVMNVFWVAGLAILIFLEKIVPAGRLVPRIAGAIMGAAGLFLLLRVFVPG